MEIANHATGEPDFMLKMLNNMFEYPQFLSKEGMQFTNPLLQNFEQIVLLLGSFLQSESTAASQKAVQTLANYIEKLDKCFPEMIDQSKEKLVGMMLQLVNDSREANKVIYVRFLEVAVEMAVRSERLCQEIARPVLS